VTSDFYPPEHPDIPVPKVSAGVESFVISTCRQLSLQVYIQDGTIIVKIKPGELMKLIICLVIIIGLAGITEAQTIGIGYIAKKGAVIYTDSDGTAVDDNLPQHFPLIAMHASGVVAALFGNNTTTLASEQEKDGRLHVRYWKNGKDADGGENTGWIDPGAVIRFSFDCCGDRSCSGIKAAMFSTRTYSDCFNLSSTEAIARLDHQINKSDDLEKMKIELEIEKIKLEREKLKTGQSVK
jgi:hypothetical protein